MRRRADGLMVSPSGPRRWLVLAVVCTSAVVNAVDNLILNAALPSMAADLGASTSELQWIVDAYVLVYAALLLVGGTLGDRFGRARLQLIGLTVFGIGSLAGAVASSAAALVLARGVMGVGSALIMPASLAMLSEMFPDARERRRAFAYWSTASGIGLAMGPVLGGALLSKFWWGSVFLVNVPVVLVALVAGWWLLPESRNPQPGRLDPLGIVLSVAAVVGMVWATIEAPVHGWASDVTLLSYLGAAAALLGFVAWELRCEHPMLQLGLFRRRRFAAANLCAVAVQFAYAGTMFCLTQLLQSVHEYSPFGAGMRIMPYAASFAIGAVCSPRLTERIGARHAVASGSITFAIGLVMLIFIGSDGGVPTLIAATVVMGLGSGSTVTAITATAMGAVPTAHAGSAAGTLAMVRQVSVALGVAIIGSILVSGYRGRLRPTLEGLALTDDERARSLDSIASALKVTHHLPAGSPLAATLGDSASDAFVHGMHLGFFAGAAALTASAVLALRSLPRDPHRPSIGDSHESAHPQRRQPVQDDDVRSSDPAPSFPAGYAPPP